jgi:hypothetical protein
MKGRRNESAGKAVFDARERLVDQNVSAGNFQLHLGNDGPRPPAKETNATDHDVR